MNEHLAQQIARCRKQGSYALGIVGSDFRAFPEEVLRLRWLRHLTIHSTTITEIPEAIADLRQLSHLHISNNPLAQIPDSIGYLHNISRLDLSRNQLSSLPDSLCNLHNLRSLCIQHNQLHRLPDNIFISILRNQPRLRSIHLEHNPIASLSNLKGLECLQVERICLIGELLEDLPDSAWMLARIRLEGHQPSRFLRYAEQSFHTNPLSQHYYFTSPTAKGFVLRHRSFYFFFFADEQGIYHSHFGRTPHSVLPIKSSSTPLSHYNLPPEQWLQLLQLFGSFSTENRELVDVLLKGRL